MIILWVLGGLYVALCLLVFFLQDALLFHPQPVDMQLRKRLEQSKGKHLKWKTADGTKLSGWLLRDTSAPKGPLLLYFGGNAEDATWFALTKPRFPGVSIAVFNYRGYGESEGVPGQKALFADALFVFDQLTKVHGYAPEQIVPVGRSLGSGVAVYLASSRKEIKRLVLVTPYDSIRTLASKMFPFLPVSLLLRHPFDSLSRASALDIPLLCFLGEKDRVIPPAHTRRLLARWKGKVTLHAVPDRGHNDIAETPHYYKHITSFVAAK